MRKINSNAYAGRIIALGLTATCAALGLRTLRTGGHLPLPPAIDTTLLAAGLMTLAGFVVLLCIELRQDRRLAAHHARQRAIPHPLPGGRYECQACGNQRIRPGSFTCPTCGIRFDPPPPAPERSRP